MLESLSCGIGLILSICLSDGIELYTNPDVHMFHNRYIVSKSWKEYNFYYAAKSGFKCSWWLILPACLILPCIPKYYYFLYVFNVCLPLILRPFQGQHPKNMYLCHQLLYVVNPLTLLCMAINSRTS
jgi:hypothetical protein